MVKKHSLNKYRRRRIRRRRVFLRFITIILVLACCVTAIVLSIGHDKNHSPAAEINTGIEVDHAEDTQSEAGDTTWYLILVNEENPIPDDYEVELAELENGQSVDKRIYHALKEMLNAAKNDGVYPVVASGYRSAEEQQFLLDEKISGYIAGGYSAGDARTEAERWVAVPGKSEHQLGIAIDVNADGVNSTEAAVYEWLNQNSCKFGFIRRYPPGKTEITGVINEPWHYRYVGVDAAIELYSLGICLEEYLDKPLLDAPFGVSDKQDSPGRGLAPPL